VGCAISADGETIVSASDDKTLKVWDGRNAAERLTLRGHSRSVERCAISADGATIVSASRDHTLKVWDGRTGAERFTLSGHSRSVTSCAMNADGATIVSASDDQTLKVWDGRTGECLATLYTDGRLLGCACAQDGQTIVAVGLCGVYFLRLVR
jgi:WD40 repeat protein